MTDFRKAFEASEARFRTLIEKNADGVLVVGRDGHIRYANPAAEALLGRPAAELVGAPFGIPLGDGDDTELDVRHGRGQAGVAEMRVVAIDWEGQPAYLAALHD